MNSKLTGGIGEMPDVERNQPTSDSVDGSLEHHLVGRVPQPRPPQKPEMHRNRYLYQSIQDFIYLPRCQAARIQVLRPCQNRLVLDNQGNRGQHFKSTVQGAYNQLPGSSTVAAQRRHEHVGIENNPQENSSINDITCDSTALQTTADGRLGSG